jgi:hypothetical protein
MASPTTTTVSDGQQKLSLRLKPKMQLIDILTAAVKNQPKDDQDIYPDDDPLEMIASYVVDKLQEHSEQKGEVLALDCEFDDFMLETKNLNTDKWSFNEIATALDKFRDSIESFAKRVTTDVISSGQYERFRDELFKKREAQSKKRKLRNELREEYNKKLRDAGLKETNSDSSEQEEEDEDDEQQQ